MNKKNIEIENSLERSMAILDGMIVEQKATLNDIDQTLQIVDTYLLHKTENYLKLQVKFLKKIIIASKNKMKETIQKMDKLIEKVRYNKKEEEIKKIREELLS